MNPVVQTLVSGRLFVLVLFLSVASSLGLVHSSSSFGAECVFFFIILDSVGTAHAPNGVTSRDICAATERRGTTQY